MLKPLLLHGPAINISRKKLSQIKEKFSPDNIVVFDSSTNANQVMANLMEIPMFSQDRLIVLENPSEVLNLPTTNYPLPTTFVIWFDHQVDVKKWPGFEYLFFPEAKEVSVFPFLDCLAYQDKKAFLEIEKLKKAGFDMQYFLTMVFYLLRNLAVTPKNAPEFVKAKLQRQRKNFPLEKVTKLYKEVLEIDFKIKSGLLEKPQAEFLLIEKFIEIPNL